VKKATKQRGVWLIKNAVFYLLLFLFKISYGLYLVLFYRIRMVKQKGFKLKGPCLLLANHLNTFDGVYIQALVSRPIRFVIGDGIFKNKYLRGLMSLVEYIPKKKFVSDSKAIRHILRVIKNKGIVGLFPEGRRTWDGKSVKIAPATFKLVKMLKVPIVFAKINGAYFTEPRWSNNFRRGKIEIEFKTLIDQKTLKQMSVEQIEEVITNELEHNEFEWQEEKKIPFKGKRLAEGFERMLYTCPECSSDDSIKTSGNEIECSVCGAKYYIDEYGYLHSKKGFLPGSSVVDINKWQFDQLKKRFDALEDGEVYMCNDNAELLKSPDVTVPFEQVTSGKLCISKDGLKIGEKSFDLEDVYGVAVNMKSHLSFRHKSMDYRVHFNNTGISVYKWYRVLQIFSGNMKEAY